MTDIKTQDFFEQPMSVDLTPAYLKRAVLDALAERRQIFEALHQKHPTGSLPLKDVLEMIKNIEKEVDDIL